MQALIQGLRALGPVRLAGMGVVGAAVMGLLAMLALTSARQPMALLYGNLDLNDAAQATEQLGRQHIPFQLTAGGTTIMVPADLVAQARVSLAKTGLPSGGSVGYELFDRGAGGLTSTEFDQQIAQTRALEGELARTIRAIAGVRAVRVHLVLPKREPFAREQQDARASVLLTMAGAARMDREGVQAVLNLVAAAVPGLKPRDVSIVDSRGELLARAGSPVDAVGGGSMSGDELRRATELRLSRAVEEMLERSLGPGHVRAEAAVRMDFDKVHETQEKYDPDGQVPRSEQSVNSTSKSTEASQTVSVQNNLPNAQPPSGGAGTDETRQEETTNYEIGKTVRTLIREQPQIGRISLAVMVDAAKAHSDADLARISDLVKTAIGFDAKRGDVVRVEAMPFVADDVPAPAKPELLGMHFEKSDLMRLAELALFGLIGIVALLTVLRPMVARLTALGPMALTEGAGGLLAGPNGAAAGALRGLDGGGMLSAGGAGPALLADESMVTLAQVEGQMRASSIRRITELVEHHPEETLTIVRRWIGQEGG
jgi:flagellar M-ring protein FliF